MRATILILAILLQAAAAAAPSLADEECPAWCGDGKEWDETRGECVAAPPKTS